MNENEALARMMAPGQVRPSKPYRGCVIQIHLTRACDLSCANCTQGSNLAGKPTFMSPEQFDAACASLKGFTGTVGVFGGNPALSPYFEECCRILRTHFPQEQCGLWCNNPRGKGKVMRETFNPRYSNLNCHLDQSAYAEFKRDWPESMPFGHDRDSRHSPVFVAMRDVLRRECHRCGGKGVINSPLYVVDLGMVDRDVTCSDCGGAGHIYDEERAWELIAGCEINQKWSAMIGVFRGELRAWFCEVAGAQSILHQDEPDYPDTGLELWVDPDISTPDVVKGGGIKLPWWMMRMPAFAGQVRKHCHECSVPLEGYGELACAEDGVEQVSQTHAAIAKPKRPGRRVEVVTGLEQLGVGKLQSFVQYLQNAKR